MSNGIQDNGFSFTYSAKEQAEIKRIREKYKPKQVREEDKMIRLRRLDASVTARAQTVSLILGVVGVLILGIGMSLSMSDFGKILGSYSDKAMLIGIAIGIFGGIIAGLAYPAYNTVVKRMKKKVAPEIMRLTDELMK